LVDKKCPNKVKNAGVGSDTTVIGVGARLKLCRKVPLVSDPTPAFRLQDIERLFERTYHAH
jgi:hypothetical protein